MFKRKRVVLNFQQKLEILKQLNEGKSGAVLAKQYGIGTSTISDIKRNGDSILQFVSNLQYEDQISEKKTRKTALNTDLDSRIYKWFSEEAKKGLPPPDAAVCAKALEINKHLTNGSMNFKASPGWLRHFKNRHGIGIKEVREESEEESCVNGGKQIRNAIKRGGYTLENVYNVDDGFLLWKSLPNCDNKDRSVVTVIACTNANGSHKLPLCVLGREKKFKTDSDSVIYQFQQSSEMSERCFENWFEDVFVVQVRNRQKLTGNVGKILLVIDSLRHPYGDILMKRRPDIDVFAASDLTPRIQPMETEIKRFKMIYRTKLLQLLYSKSPYPIKQFWEEFTLKESISVISEAWDSIPRTHIVESWGRMLSDVKNETDPIHNGVSEMVAIAQKIIGLDDCNFDDIMRWLESDAEDYCFISLENNEGNQESETESEEIPNAEAYRCFDSAIRWLTKQEECNNEHLSTLKTLRDLAASKLGDETIKKEID